MNVSFFDIRLLIVLLFGGSLCLGCIEDRPGLESSQTGGDMSSPPLDQGALDRADLDEGLADRTELDQGIGTPADMMQSSDSSSTPPTPDATPIPCEPAPMAMRNGGLGRAAIKSVLSAGGPIGADVFLATDLDGDQNREVEFIIARGGRLEVMDGSGRYWWLSEPLDIRRIHGVVDLDGDGRQEVVAIASRDVLIFDGLSGELRWSLPENVLGDTPITAVTTVLIGDFTGEEIPDLYLTDSGCGTGGTGRGAVFTFSGPEFGLQLATIAGPRENGRCSLWHTLSDLNRDGRQEILITDGQGLNAFDAVTGERLACGTLEEAPPNGPLPILPFEDGRPGWFAFLPDRLVGLRLVPDPAGPCESGFTFSSEFVTPAVDGLRPEATTLLPSEEGAYPGVLTSEWSRADGQWSVVRYDGEERTLILPDALLAGVHLTGGSEVVHFVVHPSPGADPGSGPHPCHLYRYSDVEGSVFERELGRCSAIRSSARPQEKTAEFRDQITVNRGAGPEALYRVHTRVDGSEHPYGVELLLGSGSSWRRIEMPTPFTTVAATCAGAANCTLAGQELLLAYVTTRGQVGLIDRRVERVNDVPGSNGEPGFSRPAGIATIRRVVVGDSEYLAVLNQVGNLSLFDPQADNDTPLWSIDLGRPARGRPVLEHAAGPEGDDILILRNVLQDQSGVSAIDARTGTVLWTHHQPVLQISSMRAVVLTSREEGWADTVIRYDRIKPGLGFVPDERCPNTEVMGDIVTPAEACPNRAIAPPMVTGLDPVTGACLWRTIIRPNNPCTGPGNQTISVASDNDLNGSQLFVTESNGLHMFSARNGQSLGAADLGTIGGAAGRGGGWVQSTGIDPPWIRFGGNGPPEAYGDDLMLRWRITPPDDLRGQSWTYRDALVVGESLWATPGAGWPIHRYALDTGVELGQIALNQGLLNPEPEPGSTSADVLSMVPIDDVNGNAEPGVLVSTDEGRIYGLTNAGTLAWSRRYETSTGQPSLLNTMGNTQELVVPLGNGQVQVWRPNPPSPPPQVWETPCPRPVICDPVTDIDETDDLNWLCAQWIPVDGVDGYEYRVIGTGGAPMTAWREAGEMSGVGGIAFGQQPGPRYRFQVRSFVTEDNERVYSNPSSSDGVILTNAQAPTVELMVMPGQLEAATGQTAIRVMATDDDRITGWRLDIVHAETGTHIRNLARDAVLVLDLDSTRTWDGLDRLEAPAPPGRYLAEASVFDRSGNIGVASAELIVCDGACP